MRALSTFSIEDLCFRRQYTFSSFQTANGVTGAPGAGVPSLAEVVLKPGLGIATTPP